jgi:hypothetical protein
LDDGEIAIDAPEVPGKAVHEEGRQQERQAQAQRVGQQENGAEHGANAG